MIMLIRKEVISPEEKIGRGYFFLLYITEDCEQDMNVFVFKSINWKIYYI